jgi:uncharacterized membrane protein
MDEIAIGVLAISFVLGLFVALVLGVVGFFKANRHARETSQVANQLAMMSRRLRQLEKRFEDGEVVAVEPPPPVVEPLVAPRPAPQVVTVPPEPEILAAESVASPPPPAPPSATGWSHFEDAIGKRWMTYVGAVVLFFAGAFFIKYAFDSGYVGPAARVVLGFLAGIVALVAGDRFIRRDMRALGQGIVGLGLALLFLSIYAAHGFYDLVPREMAFVGLVGVAALGMAMAVLHNSLTIAFLALLGGLLTPLLVSTGKNSRDALFAYLLLLDLSVLGVAFFRKWRALDVLAFVGSYVLFIGWYFSYYTDAQLVPAFAWLTGLFVVFLALPFVYHLRRGTPVTIERFVMAMANAVAMFALAYLILREDHQHVLGFLTLGMAAAYIGLGAFARTRVADDAKSIFGFVALTVIFLTISVPLHLKVHGITLAWAIEAPVLVLLGYRFAYAPARHGGAAVLIVAAFRLFIAHWPLHNAPFTPVINAPFAGALSLVLSAAAVAYLHYRYADRRTPLDTACFEASRIGAGLLGAGVLGHELARGFKTITPLFEGDSGIRSATWPERSALIWAAFALVYTRLSEHRHNIFAWTAGIVMLVVAAVIGVALYSDSWGRDLWPILNLRFAANAAVVAVLGCVAWRNSRLANKEPWEQRLTPFLIASVALWGLIVVSLEVYRVPKDAMTNWLTAGWYSQLGVSIVWAVYAIGLLVVGFWKNARAIRLGALGLFGLTLGKLVLLDLAGLDALFRIVAFFAVGLILLGASYLYHRVEKSLTTGTGGVS